MNNPFTPEFYEQVFGIELKTGGNKMAMTCKNGGCVCDGCGSCILEQPEYNCTICGATVDEDVYFDGKDAIGCDQCVQVKKYYEMEVSV